MAEKVLRYDRAIVKQDAFYWCGPASSQIVLNSRGIEVGENVLANELGTTVDGTAHIGLVVGPLNKRLPDAKYVAVQMPNDPPRAGETTKLMVDIRRSIDAGYGVVANIVAPPSNYPRGVKGSVSPAYAGGTVFHYIAIMGYDDQAMAVWVADSGFAPYGYWMSVDQLATLIPPKGYAYATAPSAPTPTPKPEVKPVALTDSQKLDQILANQKLILENQKLILDQLGPTLDGWKPQADLGKNPDGTSRRLREGIAALIKKSQA